MSKFYPERIKESGLEWGISEVLSGDSKFLLQSLTSSKMRKKQTKKTVLVSQSQICAGVKTLGLLNFWGRFFLCFGGQKKFCFFENILATALKSYINGFYNFFLFFFFFEKVWKSWKNWNYLHKIFVTMYSICYTRGLK